MTSLLPWFNLAQLRIIRICLIFSKPHFEQECPQLTKDLESALKAVNGLIQNSSTWIHEEDYSQEWWLLYRNVKYSSCLPCACFVIAVNFAISKWKCCSTYSNTAFGSILTYFVLFLLGGSSNFSLVTTTLSFNMRDNILGRRFASNFGFGHY